MYEARYTYDNGQTELRSFDDYDAMCRWLAQYPEAGIRAWENNEEIDGLQLADDVEYYQA